MPDWKQLVFLAIPNTEENAFLLLPADEQKWRLPLYDVAFYMFDMHEQQRRYRQDFNGDMTVLNWIGKHREESSEINHIWAIALIENHQADWKIPEGAKWFDAQALESLPLVDEWQREALLTSLKTLKEDAPAIRPAWFRKGWFTRAKQWVESELQKHGYERTGEVEQFKHWGLSALLRVETNKGNVFFKISNNFPLFANEPLIMERLAEFFPKFVPRPLAINAEERWMLMADFGLKEQDESQRKPQLLRMAREYARFQQATSSPEMISRLEAAGCFNRRISVLEAQIEAMYADEASYAALNEEELSAWKACRPQLIALCQTLASYKIPDTLVHGDFHSGNVAIREDDFLIFDWTDACISHPFFDLPVFLDYDGGENPDEVRQAYLAEWLNYESEENLETIYKLAETAAMLHQVISYQGIHGNSEAEQQSDWARAVVYFIRKIIKAVPELNL